MPSTTVNTPETYLNAARVAELWAAIQGALGEKADRAELSGFATLEAVTEAISAALSDKQDKLTGTQGQMVGFDEDGNAAVQDGVATVVYVDGLMGDIASILDTINGEAA